MKRSTMLDALARRSTPWDIVVIGGGATGAGIAVDAAARGFDVLLLERRDFGHGTSSRSTKLVHGGVRYLQQGNIALVMEALRERGILRGNAPHLVSDLRFVVPNYAWWEAPFYGIGLKVYDLLAGKYGFGPSQMLSHDETLEVLPTIHREGLRGGVRYHDGQFDDARLLINLLATAVREGATVLNDCPVTGMIKNDDGFICGVQARDADTGHEFDIPAKAVVNATGPFTDGVRLLDNADANRMIAPSRGVHVVLDRSFLPGDEAIMVPHTTDGRVMFAIPWHGHTLVGTTDTEVDTIVDEPRADDDEIGFILETADAYLEGTPTRADVRSVFAGIRPLARADDGDSTAALSREHIIQVSASGLLTIAGGKWTTYRRMAEECVDHAIVLAELDDRPCTTKTLPIHGALEVDGDRDMRTGYGTDLAAIEAIEAERPELAAPLDERLPVTGAEVVWAVREEMARTLDDVLARRTRCLFLNAAAARAMAEPAARLMAAEAGHDEAWITEQVAAFDELASGYMLA